MSEHEIQPYLGCYEPLSALSHLVGAVVFLALSVPLIRRARGSRLRVVVVSVFACTAFLVLAASGLYHLAHEGTLAREIFRRLDHSAIFIFIAGTFTAAHGILFRGLMRWGVLAFVWGVALTGVAVKSALLEAIPESVGLSWYLGLGWVGIFSASVVWRRYGTRFVAPLLVGAALYTGGALCEFARAPILVAGIVGPHELFHFAVLGGIASHWRFIASFAGGLPESRQVEQAVGRDMALDPSGGAWPANGRTQPRLLESRRRRA